MRIFDLARMYLGPIEPRGGFNFEPSLIVLELMLPDMDGYAVVSAPRQERASLARTPLLVYSALDVGSVDQLRLYLGPTEFLTRSRCSPAEFDRHVVRLLDDFSEGTHAA